MSKTSLKPGVVTGSEYKALVAACKSGGYALPAVNVTTSSTLNAVLEAAAKAKSDVVVQLSNGGAQFYAGKGYPDAFQAKVFGAVAAAQHAHLVAQAYGICVVLHTDHADKKLVPWVEALIGHSEAHFEKHGRPLFSSHMLDLSAEELGYNIDECARVLERMAKIEMSLEIELGVTGGEEDGVGAEVEEGADSAHLYTQPEDVLRAYDALAALGHFTVAASFGNVHGVYKPGNVKLRPEILKNSQALVQKERKTGHNPLDLVFHGGSGSPSEQISEAVGYGVFKMNIDTDTQFAYSKPIGDFVKAHPRAFEVQIEDDGTPYKKHYDPRGYVRLAEQGMITRLQEAFKDLGALGRTVAQ